MNKATTEKYKDMTDNAELLTKHMQDLQEKCSSNCCLPEGVVLIFFAFADSKFQPYLAKIDEIDASLGDLEKTVLVLDDYTLKLGTSLFAWCFAASSLTQFLPVIPENKFKYLKEAGKLPYKKPSVQQL
jgi:hypothetical protein